MPAASFDETVARLEDAVGRRLNGSGRVLCLAAFNENERGFRACIDEALRRGQTNPLGLLMRMVHDRDWDIGPPPPPKPVVNASGCTHEGCEGLDRCLHA
jgi:hypothetical protein